MPHLTATGTSLHRTAKSARLDLYEEGQFHDAAVTNESGDEGSVIWLPAEVQRAWRVGFERVNDVFARAVDAEAVLALAEGQPEDRWAMTVHMPGPVYVAAFTLARLGRRDRGARDARAAKAEVVPASGPAAGPRGRRREARSRARPHASTLMMLSSSPASESPEAGRRSSAALREQRPCRCYSPVPVAAASANGLPSESRHTAHRSPGWMIVPPSSRTRSTVVARSATVK